MKLPPPPTSITNTTTTTYSDADAGIIRRIEEDKWIRATTTAMMMKAYYSKI
jgi:hypothetical protein